MKDSDLNKLLRSVRPPERSPEGKADFPKEVVRQLSQPSRRQPLAEASTRRLT